MTWYRTGSVAVTLNSKNVTGTGTGWSSVTGGALVGSGFRGPDGRMYEIASVAGDTALTLVENYLGATASGQAYAIMPALGLAADLAVSLAALLQKTSATVDSATVTGKQVLSAADLPALRLLVGAVAKGGDTMLGPLEATTLAARGSTTAALSSTTFSQEGDYRIVRGIDMSSVGIAAKIVAAHRPGNDAFVQITAGASVFEMLNNGVGRSAGGWTVYSDRRVKENLQVIDSPLLRIRRLTGYTYDRTDMASMDGVVPRKAGHMAQDALQVLPETVVVPNNYDAERDEGDLLSLHHDGIAALHTECIKALEDEIIELRKQIKEAR